MTNCQLYSCSCFSLFFLTRDLFLQKLHTEHLSGVITGGKKEKKKEKKLKINPLTYVTVTLLLSPSDIWTCFLDLLLCWALWEVMRSEHTPNEISFLRSVICFHLSNWTNWSIHENINDQKNPLNINLRHQTPNSLSSAWHHAKTTETGKIPLDGSLSQLMTCHQIWSVLCCHIFKAVFEIPHSFIVTQCQLDSCHRVTLLHSDVRVLQRKQ